MSDILVSTQLDVEGRGEFEAELQAHLRSMQQFAQQAGQIEIHPKIVIDQVSAMGKLQQQLTAFKGELVATAKLDLADLERQFQELQAKPMTIPARVQIVGVDGMPSMISIPGGMMGGGSFPGVANVETSMGDTMRQLLYATAMRSGGAAGGTGAGGGAGDGGSSASVLPIGRGLTAMALIHAATQIYENESHYNQSLEEAEGDPRKEIQAEITHRTSYDSMLFGVGRLGRALRENVLNRVPGTPFYGEPTTNDLRRDVADIDRKGRDEQYYEDARAQSLRATDGQGRARVLTAEAQAKMSVGGERVENTLTAQNTSADESLKAREREIAERERKEVQKIEKDYSNRVINALNERFAKEGPQKIDLQYETDNLNQNKTSALDAVRKPFNVERQTARTEFGVQRQEAQYQYDEANRQQYLTASRVFASGLDERLNGNPNEARRVELEDTIASRRESVRKELGEGAGEKFDKEVAPKMRQELQNQQELQRSMRDISTQDKVDQAKGSAQEELQRAGGDETGAAMARLQRENRERVELLEKEAEAIKKTDKAQSDNLHTLAEAEKQAGQMREQALHTMQQREEQDATRGITDKTASLNLRAQGRGYEAQEMEANSGYDRRIEQLRRDPGKQEEADALEQEKAAASSVRQEQHHERATRINADAHETSLRTDHRDAEADLSGIDERERQQLHDAGGEPEETAAIKSQHYQELRKFTQNTVTGVHQTGARDTYFNLQAAVLGDPTGAKGASAQRAQEQAQKEMAEESGAAAGSAAPAGGGNQQGHALMQHAHAEFGRQFQAVKNAAKPAGHSDDKVMGSPTAIEMKGSPSSKTTTTRKFEFNGDAYDKQFHKPDSTDPGMTAGAAHSGVSDFQRQFNPADADHPKAVTSTSQESGKSGSSAQDKFSTAVKEFKDAVDLMVAEAV